MANAEAEPSHLEKLFSATQQRSLSLSVKLYRVYTKEINDSVIQQLDFVKTQFAKAEVYLKYILNKYVNK